MVTTFDKTVGGEGEVLLTLFFGSKINALLSQLRSSELIMA